MALPNPVPPNPGETIESAWGQSVNERVVFRYQSSLDWPSTPEVGDPWVTEQGVLLPGYSGNSGKLYVYDGTRVQEYTSWDEFGPLQDRVTQLELGKGTLVDSAYTENSTEPPLATEDPVITHNYTTLPAVPLKLKADLFLRSNTVGADSRAYALFRIDGVNRGEAAWINNQDGLARSFMTTSRTILWDVTGPSVTIEMRVNRQQGDVTDLRNAMSTMLYVA